MCSVSHNMQKNNSMQQAVIYYSISNIAINKKWLGACYNSAEEISSFETTNKSLNNSLTMLTMFILSFICSWKQQRKHTIWPARKKRLHLQGRPIAKERHQSHQISKRNSKRRWTSAKTTFRGSAKKIMHIMYNMHIS